MIFRRKHKKDTNPQERKPYNARGSQRVFSYYTASRNQLDSINRQSMSSPQVNVRTKGSYKNKVFASAIGLILLAMVIYLSLLESQAHLQIRGKAYRTNTQYQQIISAALKDSPTSRTKYLINQQKIKSKLTRALPEASAIKVGTSLLGKRPEVIITTIDPLALLSQNGGRDRYIMSTRGKVLMLSSNSIINDTGLPVIENNSGIMAREGMQIIRPSEAQEISDLIYQLKNDSSQYYLILAKQPHEIDLKESGRGYYVKFLLDNNSLLSQYGALRAAQNNFKAKNIVPTEYIDARLGEKIYYK